MTGNITANFSDYEFECPVSGESKMQVDTVRMLQALRDFLSSPRSEIQRALRLTDAMMAQISRRIGQDYPLSIVDGGGYRSTGKRYSAHRSGYAVDIGFNRLDYFIIESAAKYVGFTGIGVKNKNGNFQLHLDNAPAISGIRTRPAMWSY